MNIRKSLLLVPFAVAVPVLLAMVPHDQGTQDPAAPAAAAAAPADVSAIVRMSELQYMNTQGTMITVPSRNVLEIRLLEDSPGIRLELTYENGDYSLIDAQSFHILRQGVNVQEVRLTRSGAGRMLFPKVK